MRNGKLAITQQIVRGVVAVVVVATVGIGRSQGAMGEETALAIMLLVLNSVFQGVANGVKSGDGE